VLGLTDDEYGELRIICAPELVSSPRDLYAVDRALEARGLAVSRSVLTAWGLAVVFEATERGRLALRLEVAVRSTMS
jgi:hypothetical protein